MISVLPAVGTHSSRTGREGGVCDWMSDIAASPDERWASNKWLRVAGQDSAILRRKPWDASTGGGVGGAGGRRHGHRRRRGLASERSEVKRSTVTFTAGGVRRETTGEM